MTENPAARSRITEALRGVEAVEALASAKLLLDAINAELLDVEDRLARVLMQVRGEMENRGLF
jgi:hypothetical protein